MADPGSVSPLLEQKVTAAGGGVHWASDAEEANRIVLEIATRHHVRSIVKSKSMVSEEIGLNHALEAGGIRAYETDLGEFIVQLGRSLPIPPRPAHDQRKIMSSSAKLGVDDRPFPRATRLARQRA
jgi:L-lactate utilization protein LutB